MKKEITSVIFLSIVCSLSIFSQDTKQHKFTTDINFTGNVFTGNTQRVLLINNANFKIESHSGKTNFQSKNRYIYGTAGGNSKENDYRTSNYFMLKINKKWNPIIGFYFETLRIKKLRSSIKPLIGIQYKLIDNGKITVYPRVLIGYSWQKFNGTNFKDFDSHSSNEINGMNINFGLNASFNPFKDKIIFNVFSIYHLDITKSNYQRLWLDFNTKILLFKGLYARLSLNNYYESIVLEGIQNNDLHITYGFGYRF
ncbi:hypothetical protein DS884_17920 [Tenacibaculum sp. E3R01]|uniref:DUF481 domain-containing protein n=1 Tax=Tenacibaculum sp. E3R01 TaxID=2267227 RepID=UPI000DE986CD|nr:DUF481 domain-containing protein [Tenacibaculum sp. E3R01]RBW54325.1 hypothetical protein DS884_17920 [Tenacibaculum sp. E3R01]